MIVVGGGRTRSGKTRALRALAARNHQVLDLEALAAHRGSAFGDLKGRGAAVERGLRDEVRLGLARARRDPRRLRRGRGGPRRPVPRAPALARMRAAPRVVRVDASDAARVAHSSRTAPWTRPRARAARARPRRRAGTRREAAGPRRHGAREAVLGRGRPRSVRAPAARYYDARRRRGATSTVAAAVSAVVDVAVAVVARVSRADAAELPTPPLGRGRRRLDRARRRRTWWRPE